MDISMIKQATQGLLGGIGEIVSKFKIDPTRQKEMETEITKAVMEHEARMMDLNQRGIEYAYKEMDSARQREVSLRNTIGVWVQNIAASFVIVVFGIMVFVVLYKEVPNGNKELFYTMLGVLGTLTTTIFNYWFGSSVGSVSKDQQLHNLNNFLKGIKKGN